MNGRFLDAYNPMIDFISYYTFCFIFIVEKFQVKQK